ncbi:hypothetical protein M569_00253, partial [Genlisea aurea]
DLYVKTKILELFCMVIIPKISSWLNRLYVVRGLLNPLFTHFFHNSFSFGLECVFFFFTLFLVELIGIYLLKPYEPIKTKPQIHTKTAMIP